MNCDYVIHCIDILQYIIYILCFCFLSLDDTSVAELACEHLFEEVKNLTDPERYDYIYDAKKENPYHITMARRASHTTTRLCEIFSAYRIHPRSTNIHNLRPGEKKPGDYKKGPHEKRASDRRYSILQEASKQFLSDLPQKSSKRPSITKTTAPEPVLPIESKTASLSTVLAADVKPVETITKLSYEDVYICIKNKLEGLKQQPPSYFEHIPDYVMKKATTKSVIHVALEKKMPTEVLDESLDRLRRRNMNFNRCVWEVEQTEYVMKYLLSKSSNYIKAEMIKKVVCMACDGLSNKELLSCRLGEDIYGTKLESGGSFLWDIPVQFSPRLTESEEIRRENGRNIYSDVIRLRSITLDDESLKNQLKGIELSRSRGKNAPNPIPLFRKGGDIKGDDKLYPQYYALSKDEECGTDLCYPAGSSQENEYNVTRFYPFDDSFIHTILNEKNSRGESPIKVWPNEYNIIKMPHGEEPILLVGRSGTGKTTCCLYRLWNQFYNHWIGDQLIPYERLPLLNKTDCEITPDSKFDNSPQRLHQLFITKNYVLCSQMKKKFYDLAAQREVTSYHVQFESSDAPTTLSDLKDHSFPLFLTARHFFLILDNSLGDIGDEKRFFQRDEAGNLKVKILSSDYSPEDPDTLLDLEESDSDVENDEKLDEIMSFDKYPTNRAKLPEYQEVTSTFFAEKIWPKLSRKVSLKNAKLDPLLVWMEIKSFIKGSQDAMETDSGYLSKEEYERLGKKMAPNYVDHREDIYQIFNFYKKYCKENKLFDECDLNKSIYSRLSLLSDLQWSIHSIYVDEVQDFTQAELAILLRICRSPNDMFLSGDTAQSIMRGVSFRFKDLKSLFHEARKRSSSIVVPEVTTLQRNFRSHTGILNLAASIIDLIKYCFPASFDYLPRDEGIFEGPIPVILNSCNINDLALVMRTNRRGSLSVEFGAHQVIIVQSEKAKQMIPDVLKSNVVLTIFESKGLEFDDVLLYDFFMYSQVSII